MLQAIRDRAQGIFAWVMLILVGVPFALWGIQNYLDSGKEQPLAVVGDRDIFEREVNQAYQQSLANLVGLAEFDERQLKHEALERLIREETIAQSAEAKNLAIGDSAVREFIQTLPYFQTDGKFDKEKYKIMLSSQGLSPAQFVAQVRRALLMEHYQRGLLDSAFVTPNQVAALFRLRNQEREIEYLKIPLKKSNRAISDAEIEDYYRKNLPAYQNPERVSIEYIAVRLDDIAKQTQVTEDDLHNLYEEQKANFTSDERRKISHILVAVDSEGGEVAEKSALTKINQIQDRLAKGEDFAKVAKETSDDPVSAQNGGDLGVITKGAMEQNFADAAFALKQGELSKPVKTSFGYHLIKVTELSPAKIKPFEEVKDELLNTFQRNAAENKFYEQGQTLTELSYEHPDSLEPAAKALNLKIESTEYFTREAGDGIASESAVREAAFSEDVLNGRNSDPVELGNEKAIVLRVKEHQPASDKPLAEVKEDIIGKLRADDALQETRKQAEDLLRQVQQGVPLTVLAKEYGVSVSKEPALRRDAKSLSPALTNAVFKAARPAAQQPVAATVELENGDQAVFNLISVKDSASQGDSKEAEAARQFLVKNAAQREFSSFVAQLRQLADVYVKPEVEN
ncbi:SurA N-terminal domain-containing protein [Methylocaldum sp.]|uniref:SurA N-terminal domain-containing protein n=1 Tax=Methylocaldum sp. TaxID=1969727 RepID=UPI002D495489|nr:SurA N-terminal domain-containing protein [Methylocaldum sp.]HYE35723.1 SurA N-terminal domain-containing protein [Methylocaldum sp.]